MTRYSLVCGLGFMVAGIAVLTGCGGPSGSGGDATTILMKGSDTLTPLAQKWTEEYHKKKPEISIEASGGGTGVGIKAIIDGQCDIATASDEMTPEQRAECKNKTGKDPEEFKVAYDALAIYVHKDNPIPSLSLEQLAEMYGDQPKFKTWGDVDPSLPEDFKKQEIICVGRQNSSGTYKYFHDKVIGKTRRFKQGVLERNGSNDVVQTVKTTRGGIGYSGMAFIGPETRVVPISNKTGEPGILPSVETALNNSYPLARVLYLYTAGKPEGHVKEFIDWTLSEEGQKAVAAVHFVPLKKS